MALNKAQLAILKTELDGNPEGLGYTSDDPDCADLLNEVGLSNETIPNESVSVVEIMEAIDPDELGSIPINEWLFFLERLRLSGGRIDAADGKKFQEQAAKVFPAGAANTRAALQALKIRSASRAEVLFGAGVSVGFLDVSRARLSGQGW